MTLVCYKSEHGLVACVVDGSNECGECILKPKHDKFLEECDRTAYKERVCEAMDSIDKSLDESPIPDTPIFVDFEMDKMREHLRKMRAIYDVYYMKVETEYREKLQSNVLLS